MKWRYIICCCICACFFEAIAAQQILFRHYSVTDGLPSSTVRAITQDDQGYLWFGTKNGLSRFDGYQFKTYQAKNAAPGGIGNNFVNCISHYDSTHLWIGTENGIYIQDLETGFFVPFKPLTGKTVFDILRDRTGQVWIATRLHGLYRYDPVKDTTYQYRGGKGSASVAADQITKLALDAEGNIWIGTYGTGLNIYQRSTKSFINIRAGQNGLSNDFINAVYRGMDGTMWVGTMNGGLCRWDRQQQEFTAYRNEAGNPFSIRDNIVRAICQNSAGKLYVGTEKGLNILDIPTGKFTSYTNQSNDPFSIGDNAVYAIFSDRNETIWIGTFFGGVSYTNEKGNVFELYYPTGDQNAIGGKAVSCFLEEGPGRFWIGTEDGGLHYFNTATKIFQRYPFLPQQQKLSYHNMHCLARGKEGHIWMGLFAGGVNVYDPATGKVKIFAQQLGNPQSLNSNNVFCLYEDKDGVMWAGTDKGLNRFDEAAGTFIPVSKTEIYNTIVYDIYEDNSKTLWVATYNNGLFTYNKKSGQWTNISTANGHALFPSDKLTCLLDDHNGNLWIGSDGGGLIRYTFRTKAVKQYGEKAGINANVIFGLQQDDEGNLWATTNNGIYTIDASNEKVRHYLRQDNLQGPQFNYKAFYKAKDGRLLAGGINGFNSFYPEKVMRTNSVPRVSFTDFQLFNREVQPEEKGAPLVKQINYTKALELQYNQSVISFEFAAINAAVPEKVRYAYKMEGFDADWNYVDNQRKATYTNLSPGRYTFKVKATAEEGNWNVPEQSIQVIIHPPFYKTTVAYLLYIVLALLGAYSLHRYNRYSINRKNQIKLERLKNKEEQDFYARKIEFFTVMAHEIRTPLSLIMAPLEKLLELNKWESVERVQLQTMEENADRLLNLVNQLLDFRRIESDAYTINKENVELVSLTQAVYSRFSSLPYQKDVEFTLTTKVDRLELQADPEVMNKILSNLLINAFKFARKKVKLTIHEPSEMDDGQMAVAVSVADDGIGIPAADIKNIFRKFFTTTSGKHEYHNLGGTGIGLALASSLAEKQGGRLLVESREGVSTLFMLEIFYTAKPEEVKVEVLAEKVQPDTDGSLLVLVVDDDASIRTFVADGLQGEGYRVITATDGKEALEQLENDIVDLVISDVMMPGMDGITFSQQMKTNIVYSHIPLVLLTAKGNSEAEIEGIKAGADAYILKPFKWKHLTAVVKNLIQSRQQLQTKFSEQPQTEATEITTNVRDKEFMEKVVQAIEQRMVDPQLTVEELGRVLSMSRSNLHKKLKAMSGIGPNELIRLVRLKQAARLLATGEHNISEVAYLTGFSSPSYFSKCFLQQFKMNPTDYIGQQSRPDKIDLGQYTEL